MKFLVFAFILALMVSMIGADSSEEKFLRRIGRFGYGYGPYQPVPEQPLYPQPYQPQYQQYPF
ncbi:STATH isoform 2 [Pan troglodytes]|uniref:Statherin n=2 Tax=Pan troglodytes TaxID=9598 RepID=H2QPL0_PANTR|nr:statherin [Pan troglodytes]PNI82643.1 STATH isoform 1 [Pan troglodytes]PNI82644.1 STATH isoform 2 [Pan troglodytes]